jgi:signal transduction histidine kinase
MRRAISLRTKLVSLLAAPLVVLALLAGLGVRWAADAAARSRAAARSTEVALVSTAAALEVSRERGLAVAVLGDQLDGTTDDRRSGAELDFQRGQTDVALSRLDATLAAAGDGDRRGDAGIVADTQTRLDDLRGRVDAGQATPDAALGEYTTTVDQLLRTVSAGTDTIEDADLLSTAQSYGTLTRATEAVALQQSLLMSAFAKGALDPATYDQMVGTVATEAVWRRQFEQGATDAHADDYDAALRSPSVLAADRVRGETLAVGPTGPVADDGDLWFTATTRKVDLLKGVADGIAGELAAQADAHRAAAGRQRTVLVVLGVAALALIVGLLALLHRIVVRPIRQLTAAAHDVANDVLPRAVAVAHSDGPEAADHVASPLVAPADDELGDLTEAFNSVQRTAVALAGEQAALRRNVSEVFVNLGRRTQNLITRQLEHIDHLEARTDDPDALADLFLLDHLATRMRRNAENLLVLAGAESPRPWARPVSIVNVVRAALAESTDYSRVDIERLEPVAVVGASVSDVSHLLAELLDNALAFSPPSKRVIVTGRWTIDGRYGLAVIDAGLGMPDDRLADANARISAPPVDDFAVSRFLGLYVVGRLADRHEAEVTLTESPLGGITAHVLLPARLVVAAGAGAASVRASVPPPPLPSPPLHPPPQPPRATPATSRLRSAPTPTLTTGAGDG